MTAPSAIRFRKIFTDLVSDPPVMLAAGGLAIAFAKANNIDPDFHSAAGFAKSLVPAFGVAANALATAASIGFRVRETLTGKSKALGYFPLAAVRALTVASLATTAMDAQALRTMFAFCTGGTAFALLGLQKRYSRGGSPAIPKILYCAGNSVITADSATPSPSWIPAACFVTGLARALQEMRYGRKENPSFVERHVTPERLVAGGYGIAAALNIVSDPLYAAAFALFAGGYGLLDRNSKATQPPPRPA